MSRYLTTESGGVDVDNDSELTPTFLPVMFGQLLAESVDLKITNIKRELQGVVKLGQMCAETRGTFVRSRLLRLVRACTCTFYVQGC